MAAFSPQALRPVSLLSAGLIIFSLTALSFTVHADETAPSAAQLEALLKKSPANTKARQALARLYADEKNYDKIIKVLAAYSNEVSTDSLRLLAEAYEAKKDHLNQIRTLELYEQREPNMFRPHYLLGRAFRQNEQIDKAIENLRLAIQYAPRHRPSYDELLEIFREQKQNYESRILLNDMVREFGQKKEFLNMQCELYLKDGFLAEAQKYCKLAIKTNPRYPDNHAYLAKAYEYQQKPKAAEKVLITAARQFPDSEFVQWSIGEHYYLEKNFPIAIRYLKQAVKADPKEARSQLALALSLFENGDYKEAVDHYVTACKQDKSNVARETFRTAASKLRQKGNALAETYDKAMVKCL